MFKKSTWLFIASSVLIPILLSCSGSTNPFTASNATISIVLVNSNSQRSADSVSDTVEKVIGIGVKAFLPKYINSVTIAITRSAADTDTVITFQNPSAWTDTQWITITFHSAGTRTVSAVAVIQGEPNYLVTAKIKIAGKPGTVTYNGNGSTGGTVPTDGNTYQQGASVTVKANTGNLVKTGYTFAGWNTAVDGSGASYAGGETFTMGASNAMLYAKWTQNPTYTVTYSGNGNTGGTVPTDANAYEQGANVTVRANTGNLTRTSFTFAGWNTKADASGTSYAGGETFNIGGANVTLYAKWTQNPTYSVTYNGNGNTGGTVPADSNAYEQGANVTVKGNTGNLTKTGFTFSGWNTASDGSGAAHAGGETFNMGNANVTLYANWTQNPTYTVTYNGNGSTSGSAPIDANAYEQGANVTVKANTGNLARTAYTFTGWNTAADGSGTSYAGGTAFNIGAANVILYAVWTQNPTYTVTYNGNGNTGGSAPTDANAYEQGASVTVKANTGNLVRTAYTFAGWNTAADGTASSYAAGATLMMGSANVTLYAKWTQNPTYTVTYSGNGSTSGSAPIDANAYEQGANVTVKANTGNLAKTGFTFTGWNTAADSSGTSYAAAATFTMGSSNVTLYAKWTQNAGYTVTYDGNGNTTGTVPTDANVYAPNSSVTVKNNTGNLAKTGYTFAGWNTAADGNGTSYAGGATLTMGTASITLYAKWTQNPTYTVTYNGNGNTTGTVPTDANAYEQNATVTVKTNAGNLAKTGFTFTGWNTAADGSGTSYTASATFTMGTANVTLYAKWTIAVFTVKFNSNGGSAVDSQNVTYNSTATAPTPPTQSGFIFAGWYSDQALTVQFAFTTPITSSIMLYAKWTPVYTVTYNGNGNTAGTVPVDANTYLNGVTVTVLDNTGSLIKTGYTFSGWNTNAAGTGADRTPGSTFAMGSVNVVLYAKWTPNSYVVSFDGQGATTPSNPATMSVTSPATTVASLPAPPAKTSYIFAGWYTAVNGGGTPFTVNTVVNANVTVYAKWIIQDADGNIYTAVTIGTQVWMVQNLKTTRFNDGTMIPQVTDSGLWAAQSNPAFCWYKNNASYKSSFGALYNWYAASSGKLAPTGWHVATDAEWMAMFNFYGGQVQATSDALREAGTTHWPAPNTGATNSSGFTAIPTGFRDYLGGFLSDTATAGVWWTSTANTSTSGWMYDIAETWCEQFYAPYNEGYNVRCIRDW